jgi:hypothetical protein
VVEAATSSGGGVTMYLEANGRGDASRADGRGTAIHRSPYYVFV